MEKKSSQMKDEGLLGMESATIELDKAPLDMLRSWLSDPKGIEIPCTPGGVYCAYCWGVGLACNGWHAGLAGDGAPTSNKTASSRGLWTPGACGPTGDGYDVHAGGVHVWDAA
jgi:hypothetical protein